jgi:hypothetical protein
MTYILRTQFCFVCSWALEDKISFAAIAKLFFGKDEPNFN